MLLYKRVKRSWLFPLPEGEGQGEGKANSHLPTGNQTVTALFKLL